MYLTSVSTLFEKGWCCVRMFGGAGRLVSLFLFFAAFPRSQGDNQVCSNAEDVSAQYENDAFLDCGSRPSHKWWRSSDDCGTFSEYPACSGMQHCVPTVNESLGNNYHFCCTLSDVVQLTDSSQVSRCFHINVCIDVTDRVYPSLAFFGRQTEVFVQLHAEPPPTSLRPEVIYADSLPSDHSVLNVSENVYPATGDDLALLTYVYTFSVLEVADVSTIDRAELEFSVTLHHESPSCTDVHIFKSNIPVVQPFDVSVPRVTPSVVCPTPPTPTVIFSTQEVTTSESCSNEGLIASLVVVGVLALAIITLETVAICFLYRGIRTLKLKQSSEYSHLQLPVQRFTSTVDGQPTDPFAPPTESPPPPPSNPRPGQLGVPLRQDSQRPLLNASGSPANTPMTPPTSYSNTPAPSGSSNSNQTSQYAIPTTVRLQYQATTPTGNI